MKITFLIFYCLIALQGFSQLDPCKDWFTLNDFFLSEKIREKLVKEIVISKSDKRDDEAFGKQHVIGIYRFDESGRLVLSENFVQLSRRVDTASIEFVYAENRLQRRIEKQGSFNFSYSHKWINDSTYKEIKVDENMLDTNYVHEIKINKITANEEKKTIYNSIGRPMKSIWTGKNLFNQIVYQKESYSRSLSFLVDSFAYSATQLQSRLEWNTIGRQKKTRWKFTYVEGYLDFLEKEEDGNLTFKYAFLYNENKLVKSIVMRDMLAKTIRIYKFKYDYY